MRRPFHAAVALLATLVMACGDGTEPEDIDGTMHATVVGSDDPWDADKALSARIINGNQLEITGTETSNVTIRIILYNVDVGGGPQTFQLLPEAVPQGVASYTNNATYNFITATAGSQGTVQLTEITATRAVGTFSFVAVSPPSETNYAPISIQGGSFDVRIR